MTTNLAKFMGNEMHPYDLLFRNFFDNDSFFAPALNSQIKYPVDIYEDEKSVNIEIAVAGIDKKDIQIEEIDGVLRVSYNKEEETSNEGQHYIQKSIAKRSFSHGWKIGDKFDVKQIDAKMDKGILKISIPRCEEKAVIKNVIDIK
jgi:HSP20 family protein